MKNKLEYSIVLLILILTSTLSACSTSSNNPDVKAESPSPSVIAASSANILTLDDIKNKYTNSKILNITNINADNILVESQLSGSANSFDLYNLKTGEVDNLPTMPEYVTLEKAVNENYFIFEATGKNSESSFVSFPFIIKCFRISNDVNKQDNFVSIDEDEYYDLNRSVLAGSKDNSLLSDINITFTGFEVVFKPNDGDNAEFNADAVAIPHTKTSYNSSTNQLTLEIETGSLSKYINNNVENNTENNTYISSYKITQKDNKTYIVLSLNKNVMSYLVKIKVDGYPYFLVTFSDSIEPFNIN